MDAAPYLAGTEENMSRYVCRFVLGLFLLPAIVSAHDEKYLFVWAGDRTRSNPDFLAVINFDEQSPRYGSVIQTVPLAGAGAIGNEPHHVGISANGNVLAAGGLLSVLKGQPEIFFFDVSDPRSTRFIASADAPCAEVFACGICRGARFCGRSICRAREEPSTSN